jgi:16S rRNA (cytosine1402-N4)-methyltransferase
MHTPVLLQEVIDGLNVHENGRYIDATVGEGGHAKIMLAKGAHVLAVDQDATQIEKLKQEVSSDKCVFTCANFANLEEAARQQGFMEVDGILFDLGISWRQLSESGKGLSFKGLKEPLDMRLSDSCEMTAADILNSYPEEKLYDMLARNSEDIRSKEIAASIVIQRKLYRFSKVRDLIHAIDKANGGREDHSYSRIFQALRIEVNAEFGNLEKGLAQAVRLLNQHGRIAVITFHSVEDRMVKRFIREGKYHQITKKVIAGDRQLSFERSAKLRVFSL